MVRFLDCRFAALGFAMATILSAPNSRGTTMQPAKITVTRMHHELADIMSHIKMDRLKKPTLLTIHATDISPKTLYAQICHQMHIQPLTDPPALWLTHHFPPVSLDVDKMPFWNVMIQFATLTGLSCIDVKSKSGKHHFELSPHGYLHPAEPMAVNGRFLCIIRKIAWNSASNSLDAQYPNSTGLNISTMVLAEPGMNLKWKSIALAPVRARNYRGQSFIQRFAGYVPDPYMNKFYTDTGNWKATNDVYLQPPMPMGRSLKIFSLSLNIPVPKPPGPIVNITGLNGPANKVLTVQGLKLTFGHPIRQNHGWLMAVIIAPASVTHPAVTPGIIAMPQMPAELKTIQSIARGNGLRAFDKYGQSFKITSLNIANWNQQTMGKYVFTAPFGKRLGPPTQLHWTVVTSYSIINVPFEFKICHYRNSWINS